ncbi:hypothetical protein L218DRAFT_944084 [Marasmius fiardii PR-910]|nr:hypothetical protein L218DRAFT_944084 [Marasmius fiardii PR-910]
MPAVLTFLTASAITVFRSMATRASGNCLDVYNFYIISLVALYDEHRPSSFLGGREDNARPYHTDGNSRCVSPTQKHLQIRKGNSSRQTLLLSLPAEGSSAIAGELNRRRSMAFRPQLTDMFYGTWNEYVGVSCFSNCGVWKLEWVWEEGEGGDNASDKQRFPQLSGPARAGGTSIRVQMTALQGRQ